MVGQLLHESSRNAHHGSDQHEGVDKVDGARQIGEDGLIKAEHDKEEGIREADNRENLQKKLN